jgi:hypothetical protein
LRAGKYCPAFGKFSPDFCRFPRLTRKAGKNMRPIMQNFSMFLMLLGQMTLQFLAPKASARKLRL